MVQFATENRPNGPVMLNHHITGSTPDHVVLAAVAGTGLASYFHAVPWPEIAGFLSCLALSIQLGVIGINIIRYWLGKPPIYILPPRK